MNKLLVDTNIFLEILLNQEKKTLCKTFLNDNNRLHISDFSLHSIGVILLKYKKESVYNKFINDILPKISVVTLPINKYNEISLIFSKYNLDFDDSYQTCIAIENGFRIITLDKDFNKVKDLLSISFL